MELVEELKEVLVETAKELKGSICRLFMARTVRALGEGGQRLAEYQALNGLEEDALSTLYDAREVFFASEPSGEHEATADSYLYLSANQIY